MIAKADGIHYTTLSGARVIDAMATLWCVNAGHCRPKITEAIASQAGELDFAPTFQMGHPIVFEFANRLVDIAPAGLNHVFFTNSGSESVDTALKMAIAYHRAKGQIPGCFFSKEGEALYDRSAATFCRDCAAR